MTRREMPLVVRCLFLASALAVTGCGSADSGPTPPPPPPPISVTGVTVTAPATTVDVGSTIQLSASVSPASVAQTVTWTSSDPTRATVTNAGVVTGVTLGAVTITAASTVDPSRSGSVALTVTGCTILAAATVLNGGTLTQDSCYRVPQPLTVGNGTLVVQPGVRLLFESAGSLTVASGGRLNAIGTAAKPIRLMSFDPGSKWRGVRFDDSRSTSNNLHHVVIASGGSAPWSGAAHSRAGLTLDGTSLVDIRNTSIVGSGGQGLNVYRGAEMTFENNTLSENAVAAWVHPEAAGSISENTQFIANVENRVRVGFGNNDAVTSDQTWEAIDVDYAVQERMFVNAELTVAPGATVRFERDVSMIVEADGSLTMMGTSQDPIVFRGVDEVAGYWKGVMIQSASTDNRFSHVLFADAAGAAWSGAPDSRAAVFLDGNSRAVFTDCTFESNAHYGLWVPAGGDITGFNGNVFRNNARAMIIHPNRIGGMTANNAFTGNTENKVRVSFGNNDAVQSAQTWHTFALAPYYVTTRTFIRAPLTIETRQGFAQDGSPLSGVVEFAQDASLRVTDQGSLRTNGMASHPFIFRGGQDVVGYWQGIDFGTLSPANVLTHTFVRNAGSAPWFGGGNSTGSLHIGSSGGLALSNVTFERTSGYAVVVAIGGALTCSAVNLGTFQFYVHTTSGGGPSTACP